MIYQYILFQVFYNLSLLLLLAGVYDVQERREAIIFHIYGKKIFTQSHLTQVQAYFYKTFKEFKNDLYLWKTRKAKYPILVSTLYIFRKNFLTELHTYLYNTLCRSHHFLVSCFDSGHIFQKMWLFWKIHFVIFLWKKSLC